MAGVKILENEKRDLSLENAALKKELSDVKKLSGERNIPTISETLISTTFRESGHARPNNFNRNTA